MYRNAVFLSPCSDFLPPEAQEASIQIVAPAHEAVWAFSLAEVPTNGRTELCFRGRPGGHRIDFS